MDEDRISLSRLGQAKEGVSITITGKGLSGGQDSPKYTVELVNPNDADEIREVADVMAETFLQREPLTHALALSNPSLEKVFRSFSVEVSTNVAKVGSISVAKCHQGRIIAFVMTAPSAKHVYPACPPPGLEPWYGILDSLDRAFDVRRSMNPALQAPCNAVEFVMGGVHSKFEGQHIMPIVVWASIQDSYLQGYREIVAKATSFSQVLFQAAGAQTLAEILYKDYEYDGRHPFASIDWPATAKYMWGTLDSCLSRTNPFRSSKL